MCETMKRMVNSAALMPIDAGHLPEREKTWKMMS